MIINPERRRCSRRRRGCGGRFTRTASHLRLPTTSTQDLAGLAATTVAALMVALAAGCGTTSSSVTPVVTKTVTAPASAPSDTLSGQPGAHPGTAPADTPATADITLSCAPVNDPAGDGALGNGPTAQVTLTTNTYVGAAQVEVSVIEFGQNDDQVGTDTITFGGPFASGQTFKAEPEETNGDTSSCEIANVGASDGSDVTYQNLSPVPGAP